VLAELRTIFDVCSEDGVAAVLSDTVMYYGRLGATL
jgi:hypothetical protein